MTAIHVSPALQPIDQILVKTSSMVNMSSNGIYSHTTHNKQQHQRDCGDLDITTNNSIIAQKPAQIPWFEKREKKKATMIWGWYNMTLYSCLKYAQTLKNTTANVQTWTASLTTLTAFWRHACSLMSEQHGASRFNNHVLWMMCKLLWSNGHNHFFLVLKKKWTEKEAVGMYRGRGV